MTLDRTIRLPSGKWTLHPRRECLDEGKERRFRDSLSAVTWLSQLKSDPVSMHTVRRLVAHAVPSTSLSETSDDKLLDHLADLLAMGQWHVHHEPRPIRLASPGPAPTPKPTPSPTPSPTPAPKRQPIKGNIAITVINDDDATKKMSGIVVMIFGPTVDSKPTDATGVALFTGVTAGSYTYSQSNPCWINPDPLPQVTAADDKTVKGKLHVHQVHAVIHIKQLAFQGNNVVEKDTTGNFPSPEWLDGRAQKDQCPVAYARNKKVAFNAVFRCVSVCISETVQVKGTATFGAASLEWTGTVTVNPADAGKDLAAVVLTSNHPLPNKVGIFESTDITWQMNPSGVGWSPAGTTRNVLYITLGNPSGSPNHWTLLDISCRAAAGKSNEDDFVTSSFHPYRNHLGDGNGFKRKVDNLELTYYKFGAGTSGSDVFSCADLLNRGDGTGRCGAWAHFLVAMHEVHGVTSSRVFGVVPIASRLLIVKNCDFNGAGSLSVPFPYAGHTECVKQDGIPGQGKDNPQFTFGDHALVRHSTGIYDPSYGVGPIADLKTWEGGGIAGLGQSAIVQFNFAGDPHFLPAACSPGFILYVAVVGDTLDSIATHFGVSSGAALYGHAYNNRLRALHPPPGSVAPGDTVVIPRDIAKINILKER